MAVWTIQAKRELRHSLARLLCEHNQNDRVDCLQPILTKMQQLDDILSCTFPNARHIVVHNQLVGFRRKEETYVLLVEVDQEDQGGPYVVKIGSPEKLTDELHGWNCCKPAGLKHDLVLLPLEKGCSIPSDDDPQWMSLVYGDAQQFIGVERTVSLEEAFLNSVKYGNPSVQSIGSVLVEILERLGHLLFATSFVENPGEDGFVFRMPQVIKGIELWKREPLNQSIRTDTNVLVNHGISLFIDPVDYFEQWILPHFSWEERCPDKSKKVHPPEASLSANAGTRAEEPLTDGSSPLGSPQPQDLVPYMLRGCAHGDLHGRNILVGLVHDRALWPTVFDYEDMGPCNLPGWDFVKLETELKIRAYWEILPHEEPRFLQAVRDFEISLNTLTEQFHLDGSWPLVEEAELPIERLRAALLELRRMASIHLGKHRGRVKQWLEEYYFLLSAYGVNMAGYGNLDRRELVAAYVSAGVATARLSWPRRREPSERTLLGL